MTRPNRLFAADAQVLRAASRASIVKRQSVTVIEIICPGVISHGSVSSSSSVGLVVAHVRGSGRRELLRQASVGESLVMVGRHIRRSARPWRSHRACSWHTSARISDGNLHSNHRGRCCARCLARSQVARRAPEITNLRRKCKCPLTGCSTRTHKRVRAFGALIPCAPVNSDVRPQRCGSTKITQAPCEVGFRCTCNCYSGRRRSALSHSQLRACHVRGGRVHGWFH